MKKLLITTFLYSFAILTAIVSPLYTNAQNDVIISVDELEAPIGDTVCLTLIVENFEDIVAMQASVNFNPFLLEFTDVKDISPILGLNENNFGLSQIDSGIFRFNFFNASQPFTLPDSSSMFSLCFRVIGQAGNFAAVNITDFPIEIEIIKDFLPVDYQINNGGVHILPSDDFAYVVGSCAADSTLPNGKVFFQVYGDSSRFPATLEYQHLQSPGLMGDFTFTEASVFELTTVPSGFLVFSFTQGGVTGSTDTIEIFNFGRLNTNFEVNPPSCHDTSDGSIELTDVQPDGVYFFSSWGADGLFESKIEDLANGTYYHYITDQGGCSTIDTFVLDVTPIDMVSTITDNTCPGDSLGSILVAASGGTPFSGNTYRYTWASGEMQTTLNTLRPNLPGGIYSLTISDRNGCERTDQFELINENEINLSPVIRNVSCFGGEDGSAAFTLTYLHQEGSPDFVFSFSDSIAGIEVDDNSIFIAPLFGGEYTFTVSDTSLGGCTSEFDFEILEADSPLELEIVEQSDESCLGENDGRIEVAASGGMANPNGEYSFIWSNGVQGAILDSIGPGEYSVRLTDFLGCERSVIIEIGTTIPPMITGLDSQDPACFNSEDGSIEIQVQEGSGGSLTINWSNGDSGSPIENLAAGVYTAIVSDEVGCTDEITTELFSPDSIILSATVTDESTSGAFDGQVQISVSGGTATYTYIFGENNPTNNPLFTGLTAGDYCVTVIDANECEAEICFSVGVMTSIREIETDIIKNLYPNPAGNFIILDFSNEFSGNFDLSIIGSDGRLFQSGYQQMTNEQIKISLENLNGGIYYLRLISGESTQLIPFGIIR